MFDICYTDPTIVNDNPTILMKANYWGGAAYGITPSSLAIDIPNFPPCHAGANYDDSEFVTVPTSPAACAIIYSEVPDLPTPACVKCEIERENETIKVHTQKRLARGELVEENYPEAESKYQPIADLTTSEVNGEAACLHKMYFARCIAKAETNLDGTTASLLSSPWDSRAIEKKIDLSIPLEEQFLVFPNPVREKLEIQHILKGDFEITIFNTLGHEILRDNFSEKTTIDVSKMEGGVYLLEIFDKTSKEKFQKKIIVQ